ncbi:tetratricopeptide repeat protein [Rickettsia sp. R1]
MCRNILYRGLSLASLGRHEEALELYNQAIQIDPNYVEAYNNKGASLAALGRYAESVEFYIQFMRHNSSHNIDHDMHNTEHSIDCIGENGTVRLIEL